MDLSNREEIDLLKRVGLSDNEAKIYLALLDSGSASAGAIARLSGMHRSDVYDALERLCRKSFVCSVKDEKIKKYKVTNVNVCLLAFEEKQEQLEEQKKAVKQILPELQSVYGLIKENTDVRILRGKLGIKTLYEEILATGENYCDISLHSGRDLMPSYFRNYSKRRAEKEISVRSLIPDERITHFSKNNPDSLNTKDKREIRVLPRGSYTTPMSMRVYGENTALTVWTRKEPVVILITDEDVAKAFNAYFEMLWKIAKPLKAK